MVYNKSGLKVFYMRVNDIKSASFGSACAPVLQRENVSVSPHNSWSPSFKLTGYDAMSIRSPELTSYQREFISFPDKVINWCNKNGRTPKGIYLICMPDTYYDRKNDKYIDVYKVVNQYEKNFFKQNPHQYPPDSYATTILPEGYEMKRICGIVSVVSPEEEDLIRQKNTSTVLTKTAIATVFTGVVGFVGYKLYQYAKNIK